MTASQAFGTGGPPPQAEAETALLDKAPQKPWRRCLPRWLRSLIWLDAAAHYDAFLSYSWKADGSIAPLIQSALQQFLCPWYKRRAKNVFRDLSSLPAGSSLQKELFERIDRSTHFVVLACPEAANSKGMDMEARYWFSRARSGDLIVVVTAGRCETWEEIRDRLIPAAVRDHLPNAPVWIPLQNQLPDILAAPDDPRHRRQLIEGLRQVLLCLHAPQTWEELVGEEHAQRRRVLRILWTIALVFLGLAVAAIWQSTIATERGRLAFSRQLAVQSVSLVDRQLDLSLLLGVESSRASEVAEAHASLLSAVNHSPRLRAFVSGHQGIVTAMAYDADRKLLASGGSDGLILLWDMSTSSGSPRPLGTLSVCEKDPGPNSCGVESLAYVPGRGLLVSGGMDGNIIVWNISDPRSARRQTTTLFAHQYGVKSLTYIPEHQILASGGGNGAVVLWTLPGEGRQEQPAALGEWSFDRPFDIRALAYIPDRHFLAFGDPGGEVELLDLSNPSSPTLFGSLHASYLPDAADGGAEPSSPALLVSALAYIGDGPMLAAASGDGRIILWDLADSLLGESTPLAGETIGSAMTYVSGDKLLVTSGRGGIVFWDLSNPHSPRKVGDSLPERSFFADTLVYVPDVELLASAGPTGQFLLWDLEDPRSRKTAARVLPGTHEVVDSFADIPERKMLAYGSRDGKIRFWDVADPSSPRTTGSALSACPEAGSPGARSPVARRGGSCYVKGLAYMPDRRMLLASDSAHGRIVSWGISDAIAGGEPRDLLAGRTYHFVDTLTYDPIHKLLASGGRDCEIDLWGVSDLRSIDGPRILSFSPDPAKKRYCQGGSLAFIPDKRVLVSGSTMGDIVLWDVATPRAPRLLRWLHSENNTEVRSLAYVEDGELLASGSDDGSVVYWDVSDPRSAKRVGDSFHGLGYEYASALAYIRAGNVLVSEWNDGRTLLWDLNWASLQRRACRLANRGFTDEERMSFLIPYYGSGGYRGACNDLLSGKPAPSAY